MNEYMVIFITAPDEETAAKIANALVSEKLAGCVNIVKGIRSIYSWQGKIEDEPEALMIVKTRASLFDALSGRVKEIHPYSVPEVIAVPIDKGLPDYLSWLRDATEK